MGIAQRESAELDLTLKRLYTCLKFVYVQPDNIRSYKDSHC